MCLMLSLIGRSIADLSVFDISVCVAADHKWSRLAATGHAVDPQSELALGFSIGG
jgi:hypothetical protein